MTKPALGQVVRVRLHGETPDAARRAVNHAMWPRTGLSYAPAAWRRDHLVYDLADVLQSWLMLYSGVRLAGITPDLVDYLEDMYQEALAELLVECRAA
jgi:hypothetical protein